MPTRPSLSENQRCIATIGKLRCPGVVHELVYKGYVVRLDNGSGSHFWLSEDFQRVNHMRCECGEGVKVPARLKVQS